ncbi:triokinase/FMN cyclase-like [Daphnia pulicaria]|uniref:triokinase/FMN cyclase-like n=1 Tax=Daphnia pulicaria TaxID=35523 RepID=UPI001EEAB8B8|nr:triokinase/FMN cyclase-like [Daphnia pulicaria]
MSKKFINHPDDCVDEALEGLVMTHLGLRILGEQRVIVHESGRAANGKVGVVAGGGGGHEPFAAGFVGQGLLTAAVCGRVFSSPPAGAVLAAIRAARSSENDGVLLIVINYTGDRLNFGLALERARMENVRVKMVICDDDCALSSSFKAVGRRGLAGSLFLMKAAGALSERGEMLDSMVHVLEEMKKSIGTIGASLTSCSVPGGETMFRLEDDEVELGLGIHGEAGVKRIQMTTASNIIEEMLNRMTDSDSSCSFPLPSGCSVALIVNNLGGLSIMEMFIAAREAIKQLESREVKVVRCYVGHLMTSLEMRGIQLSALRVDEDERSWWLSLLDAPTSAPMWPHPLYHDRITPEKLSDDVDHWDHIKHRGPKLSKRGQRALKIAIHGAASALESHIDRLNELDSGCGDGDCGSTLNRWVDGVRQIELKLKYPCTVLHQLSYLMESKVGGTSCAIYGIFFAAMAKAFEDSDINGITPERWVHAAKVGLDVVRKYGNVGSGDRTLVDALLPALEHLQFHSKNCINEILDELLAACEVAEEEAEKTAGMRARVGRASYVNEDLLSKPDAGATAVAIWFRGFVSALDSELHSEFCARKKCGNRRNSISSSSSSDVE